MTKDHADAARVRIFPPAVPLVTILSGIVAERWLPLSVICEPGAPLRNLLGGAVVVGSVLGLGLWSVLLVRGSDQSENPWKPTTAIIDRGPFRISRNPMYLQMVLVCLGFALALWNAWILVFAPVCAWLLQRLAIEPEEAYLEQKFGEAYVAYKRRVRRWL